MGTVIRGTLVVLVLLFAGCGGGSDDEGGGTTAAGDGGDGGSGASGAISVPSQPVANAPTLGEVIAREQVNGAARENRVLSDARVIAPLLNAFWTRELQADYRLQFDDPDRFEYYRGDQPRSCGGGAPPSQNNAYYCAVDVDEHVAFDLNWLQGYLVQHPDDATTFLILAHEWGHAVQDTWVENRGGDVWNPPYRKELNADCLAGVFISSSIKDGTIIEEADDAKAIFGWLNEAGSSPWLAPGDHGTSTQRQLAFTDGTENGTDYCRRHY